MSNRARIKVRAKKQARRIAKPVQPEKPHTSFNIFTQDGKSLTDVKSPRPMYLAEAQAYFKALCIGAND
jgi:hypothetical protein